MLWLCEVLRRFLDGEQLSEVGYESNPPLSMLAYLLPVLAKSWLGFPLHYAIFVQTTLFIAFSATAVYKIIAAWNVLEKQTTQIITAGYLLAITVGASLYHGERDHLVGLGLIPFILAQITLTFNLPQARAWMKPVFALGAILILLKPHHGLIPTLLLVHRAVRQRRLSVPFDADFISLTVAVLSYAALIFTIFPDYAFTIFPDVFRLYLPVGSINFVAPTLRWVTALCFGLLIGITLLKLPRQETLLMTFFVLCAALSMIPYAVQKMGFYYHILPALAFLFMPISVIVLALLRKEIKSNAARGLLAVGLMITMSYIYAPLNIKYPNHHFFEKTPIAKLVTNCPDPNDCKFFMLNREMGILHETAYYTGTTVASRFPSPWYVKLILDTERNRAEGTDGPLTNEEYDHYFNRYAEMTTEDMIRFKPHYLIIWDWRIIGPEEGFVAFLSRNKKFAEEMQAYQEKGPFHINYINYYTGLKQTKDEVLDYTVYERKPGK